MNNIDRVIERLNYDIEEIELLKSECLLELCSFGKKIEGLREDIKTENNISKFRNMLSEIAIETEKFNECKEIYSDLVDDIKALSNHISTVQNLNIREAILLLA